MGSTLAGSTVKYSYCTLVEAYAANDVIVYIAWYGVVSKRIRYIQNAKHACYR